MHTLLSLPREIRDLIITFGLPPITIKEGIIHANIRTLAINMPQVMRPSQESDTVPNLLLTNWQLNHETKECIRLVRPTMTVAATKALGMDQNACTLRFSWSYPPLRYERMEEIDLKLVLHANKTYDANISLIGDVFKTGSLEPILSHMIDTTIKRDEVGDSDATTEKRHRNTYDVKRINIYIFPSCDIFEAAEHVTLDRDDALFQGLCSWKASDESMRTRYSKEINGPTLHRRWRIGDGMRQELYNLSGDLGDNLQRVAIYLSGDLVSTCYMWGRRYGQGRRRKFKKVQPDWTECECW